MKKSVAEADRIFMMRSLSVEEGVNGMNVSDTWEELLWIIV